MSALFDNPVLIEVTAGTGSAVRFTATHRKIVTPRMTDYDNVQRSIAEHLARVSATGHGKPVGAVVFNAAVAPVEDDPNSMQPLGFLVADPTGTRPPEPGEVSDEQLVHWEAQHKAWKRVNRFPRRRVLETAPPSRTTPEPEEAPVTDQHRPWEDIDTVEGPEWDPVAVSRLTPAVASIPAERLRDPLSNQIVTHPQVAEGATLRRRADRPRTAPAPAPREAPARPTRASELESLMDRGKHTQDAQDGLQGALNKLGLGLHIPPGRDEQYRRERMRSILAGWSGTRFATVADEKGGTCKTPTAMLLAGALSIYGRGSVILRDGNPTGNAHERGEFTLPLGVRRDGSPFNDEDLARFFLDRDGQPLDNATMAQFLHFHTTDGYGLVATADSGEDEDRQMGTEEVDATYEAITPHASAVVTDTSNHPFDRRDRMVLQRTHQLVIPMLARDDKENGARKTAIRLEKRNAHCADLVANAVAVIHVAEHSRANRVEAQAMAERWRRVVRHVVVVPFDPHMGSNSLRFRDLALPTQSAFLDLAAAVADGFRAA